MGLFSFISRLKARAAGQGLASGHQAHPFRPSSRQASPDDDPFELLKPPTVDSNFDFLPKPPTADRSYDFQEEEAILVDSIAPRDASANQVFANTLFHELRRPVAGNLCFSPYTIAEALTMAQVGAAGRTRQEIESALGYPGAGDQLIEAAGKLHHRLLGKSSDVDRVLTPVSALWHQAGYPIHAAFVDALKSRLGAEVHSADFAMAPDAAVQLVNEWVAAATRGKIQDVLTPGKFRPLTRVLLISVVHLKARWSSQFWPESTHQCPFHLVDGSAVRVPMMRQRLYVPAVRDPEMQAVAMPYADGNISMVVILPDEGKFEKVQRELNAGRLEGIIATLEPRSVELVFPKFRIESTFELRRPLESIGIVSAFGGKATDFSRISPRSDLMLGDVIHKTYIDVDETGTEAAAVTIADMPFGMRMPMPFVRFQADRPFLFVIRDDSTGTPLFMGRVMDPRG